MSTAWIIRFWTLTWEDIERRWPGLNGIWGGELDEDEDDDLWLADSRPPVTLNWLSPSSRRGDLDILKDIS
jgi:hypothetical protein